MTMMITTTEQDRAFMSLLNPDRFGSYGGLVRAEFFTDEELSGVATKMFDGHKWVRIKTKQALPLELDGPMSEEYLKRYAMHEAARWPMRFGKIQFDITKFELSPDIIAMHSLPFTCSLLIKNVRILSWKVEP